MTIKHTPGPWECNQSEIDAHSSLIEIRGLNGAYTITKDVGWQNARLIACAPELLEACKWFISEWNDTMAADFTGSPLETVADKCRAAIFKAEGQQ